MYQIVCFVLAVASLAGVCWLLFVVGGWLPLILGRLALFASWGGLLVYREFFWRQDHIKSKELLLNIRLIAPSQGKGKRVKVKGRTIDTNIIKKKLL